MDIFILVLVSIMWSFVGTLVKTAGLMVNSSIVSFCRFFFGIIFLGIYILLRDKKIKLIWKNKWIWVGVAGKSCNYIFENIGLSLGTSYGNIMAAPFQTIIILIISVAVFKEKLLKRHWLGILFSILGISLVSWNGVPLKVFLSTNIFITILFILSAVGVVMHTLSQKMLIKSLDSGVMNLSVFTFSTLVTVVPMGFNGRFLTSFNPASAAALLTLGFITGVSFFLYAKALKKVSLLLAVIIGNSSMFLNVLWGRLFFNEKISIFIATGTFLFIAGVTILNLPVKKVKN